MQISEKCIFSLGKIWSHATCARVLKQDTKWTPVGHVTTICTFIYKYLSYSPIR